MVYEKRTSNDFSRAQKKEIGTEYANSGQEYSQAYFTEKYCISVSTFYTIIHNCVSQCIVSNEIANKIRDKACANSRTIAGRNAAHRSFNTYRMLFFKRASFRFKKSESIKYAENFAYGDLSFGSFCTAHAIPEKLLLETLLRVLEEKQVCNETAELIMNKLANYYIREYARRGVSQNEFCVMYSISKELLAELLQRAVIRNLVSDDVVLQIRNNALRRHDPDRVYDFFNYLERERLDFINGSNGAL